MTALRPIRTIKRHVVREFDVDPFDLNSKRRSKSVSLARHVALYLSKKLTTFSYPQIGQAFGVDHTTVIYGERRIEDLLERDADLALRVEVLLDALTQILGPHSETADAIDLIADKVRVHFRQLLKLPPADLLDALIELDEIIKRKKREIMRKKRHG